MSRALVLPRGNTSEIWSQKTNKHQSRTLCWLHSLFHPVTISYLQFGLAATGLSFNCPFLVACPCSRCFSLFFFFLCVLVLVLGLVAFSCSVATALSFFLLLILAWLIDWSWMQVQKSRPSLHWLYYNSAKWQQQLHCQLIDGLCNEKTHLESPLSLQM